MILKYHFDDGDIDYEANLNECRDLVTTIIHDDISAFESWAGESFDDFEEFVDYIISNEPRELLECDELYDFFESDAYKEMKRSQETPDERYWAYWRGE